MQIKLVNMRPYWSWVTLNPMTGVLVRAEILRQNTTGWRLEWYIQRLENAKAGQ